MADDATQQGGQTNQSSGGQQSQSGQAAGAQGANSGAQSGAQSGTQSTQQGQQQQTQQQAAAPTRPDWLPEQYFDAKVGPKFDDFGKHYTELATRDAAEAVRRATLPAKPADVKLELPKDFKLPQGVEFKFDATKPEFSKFQEIAVKRGLDQDTVTDLMGVYAETLVGSETTIATARKAEMDKMGANGTARITNLNTVFKGVVGEDGAKHLNSMMVTADIVSALEKIAAKFSSQGVASFSQQHRDATPPNKVSDEEWAKMSPAAKLDYSRSHDQSQFQKSNGAAT